MRYRIAALTVGFAVIVAACTSANGNPATAPPVPDTLPTTTTTAPATTTVAPRTTTTLDRLTEIQAIFEDLERRRLQALYSGDAEAFGALFVDNPYREESLRALDIVEPGDPPELAFTILEVLRDDPECLVIVVSTSSSQSDGPSVIDTTTMQPIDGGWGYAYVEAGRGNWLCTEPHPLSG